MVLVLSFFEKTTAKNEANIKLLCPCCSCLLLQPQSWVWRYRCCLQKCRREHVPVYGAGAAVFPHKTPRLYLRPGLKCSLLRRGRSRNRSAKVGAAAIWSRRPGALSPDCPSSQGMLAEQLLCWNPTDRGSAGYMVTPCSPQTCRKKCIEYVMKK